MSGKTLKSSGLTLFSHFLGTLSPDSREGSRVPRPRLVTLCDQASTPAAPGFIQPTAAMTWFWILEVHFQDSYLIVSAPQRVLAALQIIPPVLQLLF